MPRKPQNLAQLAALDHLARQGEHGVADVVEAHLGHDAGAFGRQHHRERFLGRRRQRLLTIDGLAEREGRERDRRVQLVGGGDVDDIDRRVIHQRLPIADRAREAVSGSGGGGQLIRRIRQ